MVANADDFIRFHARQGLVLWGWGVLAGFALYLPGIGKLFFVLSLVIVIALSLGGIISVLLFRAWRLPLIYQLSRIF